MTGILTLATFTAAGAITRPSLPEPALAQAADDQCLVTLFTCALSVLGPCSAATVAVGCTSQFGGGLCFAAATNICPAAALGSGCASGLVTTLRTSQFGGGTCLGAALNICAAAVLGGCSSGLVTAACNGKFTCVAAVGIPVCGPVAVLP